MTRRLLKLAICAGIFFAALLIGHHNAHAATFRSPELEAKLPLPCEVYVTDDTHISHVSIGEPRIYLAAWVGRLLLHGDQNSIDPGTQLPWAMAIHTLYHEWWHLAFREYDEQNADLGALAIMRGMLRRYWDLPAADAQKNYEFVAGINGVSRSAYHPHYTPTAVDPILAVGV